MGLAARMENWKGDLPATPKSGEQLETRLNSVKLSDSSFSQDLKFLLALPDGQSISGEAQEGHQSSRLELARGIWTER
jgi:hypothetical protein